MFHHPGTLPFPSREQGLYGHLWVTWLSLGLAYYWPVCAIFFSELIWGCKRIKEGFVLLTLTLEEKKSVENLTSAL